MTFKLRNGRILLSTEAPGGIYNSNQLNTIAVVCEDESALVKATEDQRLALFVDQEKADEVVQKLQESGLGIRHYQQGLHQPTTCIGEFCPDHQQDALGTAIDITQDLSEIVLNSPLKIGINGCATCCVPCHTLDVSIIGDTNGYRVSLAGKNSQIPEMASFMAEGVPNDKISPLIKEVVTLYSNNAQDGESLQDVMDRIGATPFIEALAPYSQDAATGSDDPFSVDADSTSEIESDNEASSNENEENLSEEGQAEDLNDSNNEDLPEDLEDLDEVRLEADSNPEMAEDIALPEDSEDLDGLEISPQDHAEEGELTGDIPISEHAQSLETLASDDDSNPVEEISNDQSAGDLESEDESTLQEAGLDGEDILPEPELDVEEDSLPEPELDVEEDSLPEPELDVEEDSLPEPELDVEEDSLPEPELDVEEDSLPEPELDVEGDSLPESDLDLESDGLPETELDVEEDSLPEPELDLGKSEDNEQTIENTLNEDIDLQHAANGDDDNLDTTEEREAVMQELESQDEIDFPDELPDDDDESLVAQPMEEEFEDDLEESITSEDLEPDIGNHLRQAAEAEAEVEAPSGDDSQSLAPSSSSSWSVSGIDIGSGGEPVVKFASGAEISLDPNQLGQGSSKKLRFGDQELTLSASSDGVHIEVSGVRMFFPGNKKAA